MMTQREAPELDSSEPSFSLHRIEQEVSSPSRRSQPSRL